MNSNEPRNRLPLALALALIWGATWAGFLQFTQFGRYLAKERTWVTVVAGVGMDLAIAVLVIRREAWTYFTGIITASSLPIIFRSLWNESKQDLIG